MAVALDHGTKVLVLSGAVEVLPGFSVRRHSWRMNSATLAALLFLELPRLSFPLAGSHPTPVLSLFYKGRIDEVALYNGALDGAAVKAHFIRGTTPSSWM